MTSALQVVLLLLLLTCVAGKKECRGALNDCLASLTCRPMRQRITSACIDAGKPVCDKEACSKVLAKAAKDKAMQQLLSCTCKFTNQKAECEDSRAKNVPCPSA